MIDSVVNDRKCTGCYSCKDACAVGAIELKENADGFREAQVNEELCVKCGKCQTVCPVLHREERDAFDVESYAFRADDAVRKVSSSGGLISVAALVVLGAGGKVCGVELGADVCARYIVIDKQEDLEKIRGSKYLQADASGIYNQVKDLLQAGQTVLFVGLPCQVAGLYNHVKDCDQTNLYTIDLLCHGTPSDKVVKEWLKEISKERTVQKISFRLKDTDWNCNAIQVDFTDGSSYKADVSDDYFEKLFHYNVSLRETCYECSFAEFPRRGDISTGDFHGLENCSGIEDDHKGTSVIFVNSSKGQQLFEKMAKKDVWLKGIPVAASDVNRIHTSIDKNPCRERFFRLLNNEKYDFGTASQMALERKYDIGVVGIPTVENHGSNLSYYALYRTLKHMGYEVLMVERPKSAWWGPHENPIIFQENPYDDGDLCDLFGNRLQMQKVNDYADTFILGSDQLWYEGLYACFDKFCFLDYINQNKKKITYAASFGRSHYGATKEEKAEAAFFVQGIDSISVREQSAVDLCKAEWDVDAEVVLDPVFLCPTEEYVKLTEKAKKAPYEHYIATYILDPSLEKQRIVERIAAQLDLPVINMTDVINVEEKCAGWGLPTEREVSNEDWLARIKESDFFVTDSFHGSCFAIIFEKEFLAIGNEYRGIDRFTEILGKVKLESRLVLDTDDTVIDERLKEKIDYQPVREALQIAKQKSVEWLCNAIEKEKTNRLSLYDVIQKEIMVQEEKSEFQKSIIDAQGNVIGAHDKRMEVYDVALRQLQEEARERRIAFETQQVQMQEFQEAIISLRDISERLRNENEELWAENARLCAELEQLKDKSWIKKLIRKIIRR